MNQTGQNPTGEVPKLNFLERFLIYLSAADSDVLAQHCPKWERLKYAAFGASILVPFFFGMIASAYAISTLTTNWWIIGGFSLVWGFIIITIDRVLLSTYRAFVPFSQKVAQFILRITVAVLMGLTVSHPLTLLLFKDTIISEIERERIEEMATARQATDQEKKDLDARIEQAVETLKKQEQRLNEVVSGSLLNSSQVAAAPAPQPTVVDTHTSEVDAQIKEYKRERDQVQADYDRYAKIFEEEISGARTGKAGMGPNARAIQETQLIPKGKQLDQLNNTINDLTKKQSDLSAQRMAESAAANAKIDASKRQLEQQKLQLYTSQQGEMVDQVNAQIASATAEVDRLREEAKKLSLDSNERVDSLKGEKRLDLMVQTLVLHKIFKKEGGGFALAVYIVIGSLFTLIDIIPLVVKFFAVPGIYDNYQESREIFKKTLAVPNHFQKGEYHEFIKKEVEKVLAEDDPSIRANQAMTVLDKLDLIKSIHDYDPNNLTPEQRQALLKHVLAKAAKGREAVKEGDLSEEGEPGETIDNQESAGAEDDSEENVIPFPSERKAGIKNRTVQTAKRQAIENPNGSKEKEELIDKPGVIKIAGTLPPKRPSEGEVKPLNGHNKETNGNKPVITVEKAAESTPAPVTKVNGNHLVESTPAPVTKVNGNGSHLGTVEKKTSPVPVRGVEGKINLGSPTNVSPTRPYHRAPLVKPKTSEPRQEIVQSPVSKPLDPQNDLLEEPSDPTEMGLGRMLMNSRDIKSQSSAGGIGIKPVVNSKGSGTEDGATSPTA